MELNELNYNLDTSETIGLGLNVELLHRADHTLVEGLINKA